MIVAFIIISTITVLVMAEEFDQLPKSLQNLSSSLVHNQNCRNILICGIVIIMATSISLSLPTLLDGDKENNKTKKDILPQTIIISNLNVYENGLGSRSFELENGGSGNNKDSGLSDEHGLLKNQQEVILNLFLTATVHHNITFNGIQIQNIIDENCETDCDEQKIKDLVMKFIEKLKNNSVATVNLNDIDEKILSNLSNTGDDKTSLNCSSNVADCPNSKHSVKKRSILPEIKGIEEYVRYTSTTEGCKFPEYVVFMWVLCLIALATALKLYYLIKTILAVAMVILYMILIMETGVFEESDKVNDK